MEEKHIDRLFQEKLIGLEVTPNKQVWNTIESKLKKKKRRVLPIWWLSSGIAAILILGLFIFPFSKKSNSIIKSQPIITKKPKKNHLEQNNSDTHFNNIDKKNSIVKKIKSNKLKQHLKTVTKKQILIAKKVTSNNKELVSKKTKENSFLTTNQLNKTFHSIKEGTIIVQENKLITLNKKEAPFIKESESISKSLEGKTKPKELFVAIENKEKKQDVTKQSWSVSPVIAVLSSNSFSNASPIDERLSNSTQGNSSYSYGVQIEYQLNNKWSIQSGIHLQEIRYSNNQIAVTPTNSGTSSISFNSGNQYTFENLSKENFDTNSVSLSSLSLNGNLKQKYGYVEIPIEVKYNVLESKKIKTEIVIGFSSLFLNKNSIDLTADSFSTSGAVTNLNSLNFSGNLGVDLNYSFHKNWSLNLNPMFKSQLNTFSENSNGFKPYFIGVYTGVSYQF